MSRSEANVQHGVGADVRASAATLTVFVFKGLVDATKAATRSLIERGGFDVIDVLDGPMPAHDFTFVESAYGPRYASVPAQEPCTLFIAVDLSPWRDRTGLQALDPRVDNERIARIDELRELLEGNPSISATLNTEDAWRLLETFSPSRLAEYRREISAREHKMTPPFPIVRDLTDYGNNAKTYLCEHRGKRAICKVFRPGRERQLQNELNGLALGQKIAAIPKCVEAADNWLVMELAEQAEPLDLYKNRLGLIRLRHARGAFEILREIHDAGYAHMDFRPHHVLVTPDGKLTVIDFDRLHRYDHVPAFENSFSIVGYDPRLLLDAPNGPPPTYSSLWEPCIGLSFASLQRDPAVVQHLKRCKVMLRRVAAGILRRLLSLASDRRRTS